MIKMARSATTTAAAAGYSKPPVDSTPSQRNMKSIDPLFTFGQLCAQKSVMFLRPTFKVNTLLPTSASLVKRRQRDGKRDFCHTRQAPAFRNERRVGKVRTLVLFITSRVWCSGEGGLKGDGVRRSEAGVRERQSAAGRESPAGVTEDEPRLQPCVFYTCTHEDHSYCV